ncbi:hypothetical protein SDC9_137672 [bioreactor metagenome]|uniref:Uncharacterized protein n=1 Tax=bioreactor metagenome TaxID=1076179 RepID=A0A645DMR6_9ZZZZ
MIARRGRGRVVFAPGLGRGSEAEGPSRHHEWAVLYAFDGTFVDVDEELAFPVLQQKVHVDEAASVYQPIVELEGGGAHAFSRVLAITRYITG